MREMYTASGTGRPRQSNNRKISEEVVVLAVVEISLLGGLLTGWRIFRVGLWSGNRMLEDWTQKHRCRRGVLGFWEDELVLE